MGGGSKPSDDALAQTAPVSADALASSETVSAADDLASGETTPAPAGRPARARAKRPSEVALPRGAQLGRYRVVDKLGGGGMGIVYAAYDPELDRQVALKVMRPSTRAGNDADARARLLREAQAMARLAHPNVVPVYDVGTFGDDVFVAMELVTGLTLREWLKREVRGWRTIIAAFTEAGHGLAAAHAAGLVHRDFKPENVLVGQDGRVRVLDFGLARTDEAAAAVPLDRSGSDLSVSQRRLLDSQLTQTGALMGTPLYMSPEQWNHAPTDARSDQFSFCVALFEALWGTPPFAGRTVAELSEAVSRGVLIPPPASSEVPARIRNAIVRGLSRDPAARFPTLNALLAQLGDDPRAARRKRLVAIAVTALVAAAIAVATLRLAHPHKDPCAGSRDRLAGVWDGPRRAALAQAFAATKVSYAGDTQARVVNALDAYAAAWVAMHDETCRATNVRHEQSDHLLDLRMACLDGRLHTLAAQVDVLVHADAQVVPHAIPAVQELPSLAACADAAALSAAMPPPSEPAARAELAKLQQQLDGAIAQEHAGHLEEQQTVLEDVVARARSLGYPPLTANALHELGGLKGRLQDFKGAMPLLREAELQAEAASDRELAAHIWASLTYAATEAGDYAEAAQDGQHAEALLTGSTSLERRSELDVELGTLAYFQGKADESVRHYQRALADREKLFGPNDFRVGVVLDNLGITLEDMGKKDEALATHQRAVAIAEASLGPDHPDLATSLNSLGVALHGVHRDDEALAAHRRALAILEKALGPDNGEVGATHSYIAQVLMDTHHTEDGLAEYTRALAIEEKALGPDHPNLAYDLLGIADGELEAKHTADAIAHYERALHLRETHNSPPIEIAQARYALARALVGASADRSRAIELATAARDAYRADPAQSDNAAAVERWLAKHAH
ncbi:MAG: serine/threonine protein kinase [Deltaproteobacteria bacterium]|nr:serine/threonine protein kinase [Deltaproteobacteria bacterium]